MIYQYGKGPVLVFINGYMSNHILFKKQIKEFSKHYTVIIQDIEGEYVTVESLMTEINEKLQELKAKKFILCGYSLGGVIAMFYAHLYQDRIKKLILMSTTAEFCLNPITFLGFWVTTWLPMKNIPAFSIKLSLAFQGLINKNDECVIQDIIQIARLSKPHNVKQQFRIILNRNRIMKKFGATTNSLRKLKIPVLIISGTADRLIKPKYAKQLNRLIPNSQLILIKDSGHYYMLSKPELTNGLIKAFIEE